LKLCFENFKGSVIIYTSNTFNIQNPRIEEYETINFLNEQKDMQWNFQENNESNFYF